MDWSHAITRLDVAKYLAVVSLLVQRIELLDALIECRHALNYLLWPKSIEARNAEIWYFKVHSRSTTGVHMGVDYATTLTQALLQVLASYCMQRFFNSHVLTPIHMHLIPIHMLFQSHGWSCSHYHGNPMEPMGSQSSPFPCTPLVLTINYLIDRSDYANITVGLLLYWCAFVAS